MAQNWRGRRTVARLLISFLTGMVAAVLAALVSGWRYIPSVGWDATGIVFCALVWRAVWGMTPASTAQQATEEDPSRANTDILLLSASVISLLAVSIIMVQAHRAHGGERLALAALGLLSVAVSWFTVHTIFMLRYALLYYSEPEGGIDFGPGVQPSYRDFAYVALTLGMTYQVSDTALSSTVMRGTALRHALLSYLFGAVILAVAINLIASLS
jgi:uncharacterized membrane protein